MSTPEARILIVEDEAIRNIVQLQRDVGIKGITDGEFRRYVIVFLFYALLNRPL